MKHKFNIGDKVKVIAIYDEIDPGYTGVIVGFEIKDEEYAVKINEDFEEGHSCNGLVEDDNGYYMPERCLELLNKLTKKKRDELRKKAINYIKKNKDSFECFDNDINELKKEVGSWSDDKLLDFK